MACCVNSHRLVNEVASGAEFEVDLSLVIAFFINWHFSVMNK